MVFRLSGLDDSMAPFSLIMKSFALWDECSVYSRLCGNEQPSGVPSGPLMIAS